MKRRDRESIVLYLTQMGYDPDRTFLLDEDDNSVIVESPEGSRRLTVNLFEDIVEIYQDGSQSVVAVSDLPHEGSAKRGRRAVSWRE